MQDYLDRFVERYMTPPPMPPAALPPGVIGKALRPVWELQWMSMGYHMLLTGVCLGSVGVLVVFAAILCRANIKSILRSLITNGVG